MKNLIIAIIALMAASLSLLATTPDNGYASDAGNITAAYATATNCCPDDASAIPVARLKMKNTPDDNATPLFSEEDIAGLHAGANTLSSGATLFIYGEDTVEDAKAFLRNMNRLHKENKPLAVKHTNL